MSEVGRAFGVVWIRLLAPYLPPLQASLGDQRRSRLSNHKRGVSNQVGVQFMTGTSVGKRFGIIHEDQQRAMSGLEFVQGLVDGTLPLNTMAQTLGYDIVEVSRGRVVAAAEPQARHRNPAGTVHGGLAATLLDSCMGLAVQSMLDKGFAQTTLEFKISLVRPITP
jgi:acyl-coenzyme A thioesterase PaaI-like protein